MGVIEETRQLIQDFLAPKLRTISARLDALENRMDERFRGLDNRFIGIDERFRVLEQQSADRHAQLMHAIARLADVYELKERIARIEARERAS
jgi:hypothetical protein